MASKEYWDELNFAIDKMSDEEFYSEVIRADMEEILCYCKNTECNKCLLNHENVCYVKNMLKEIK